MPNQVSALRGVCHLYSETGTEGGYWAFQDERYISADGTSWSYMGMHVLKNGDSLKIFQKESPATVVWSGIISLKNLPLFSEDASGFWIHADQDGIDREVWARYFLEEYPAELILAPDSKNPSPEPAR